MTQLIAEFVVSTVEERDFELSRATKTARFKAAMGPNLGVLITRHNFFRYSVALTPDVPFGTVYECDHAGRHRCPENRLCP